MATATLERKSMRAGKQGNDGLNPQFRKWLTSLWTTADLERKFGKSRLTISFWVARDGLPCVRIPGDSRDTIRFDPGEVIRWAREHHKEFNAKA